MLCALSAEALDTPSDLDLKAGYCMGPDRVHLADLDKSTADAITIAKSRSDYQARIDRLRAFLSAKNAGGGHSGEARFGQV